MINVIRRINVNRLIFYKQFLEIYNVSFPLQVRPQEQKVERDKRLTEFLFLRIYRLVPDTSNNNFEVIYNDKTILRGGCVVINRNKINNASNHLSPICWNSKHDKIISTFLDIFI